MQIKNNWDQRCGVCNDVITNPICNSCLNKEINQILKEKNLNIDLLEKSGNFNKITCILCNKPIDICPYCHLKENSKKTRTISKIKK